MARARVSARRQAASEFQAYRVTSGSKSNKGRSSKAQNVRRRGGGASRTVNAVKPL